MPAPPAPDSLRLDPDGAERFRGALGGAEVAAVLAAVAGLPEDRAGVRVRGVAALTQFLVADGPVGRVAAAALGPEARPVRAVLFDKAAGNNWSLAWHQDRTVVVTARVETEGFGPWSVKAGLQHVAPPWSVLEGMVTLRVHLDPAGEGNAPLLIAPGSHRLGPVPAGEAAAVAEHLGPVACLAEAGDVWVYRTPILHASEAATAPARRRVLQVDYAAAPLPGGLEWAGV
jgi:hypothetical protein